MGVFIVVLSWEYLDRAQPKVSLKCKTLSSPPSPSTIAPHHSITLHAKIFFASITFLFTLCTIFAEPSFFVYISTLIFFDCLLSVENK